jgi:hypothetical protein
MTAIPTVYNKRRHCKHGVAKAGKRKGQCLKHKRSRK